MPCLAILYLNDIPAGKLRHLETTRMRRKAKGCWKDVVRLMKYKSPDLDFYAVSFVEFYGSRLTGRVIDVAREGTICPEW